MLSGLPCAGGHGGHLQGPVGARMDGQARSSLQPGRRRAEIRDKSVIREKAPWGRGFGVGVYGANAVPCLVVCRLSFVVCGVWCGVVSCRCRVVLCLRCLCAVFTLYRSWERFSSVAMHLLWKAPWTTAPAKRLRVCRTAGHLLSGETTCGHVGARSVGGAGFTCRGASCGGLSLLAVTAMGDTKSVPCTSLASNNSRVCAADVNNAARAMVGMSAGLDLFVALLVCTQERSRPEGGTGGKEPRREAPLEGSKAR